MAGVWAGLSKPGLFLCCWALRYSPVMAPLLTPYPSRLMGCVQLMTLLMRDLPRGAFRRCAILICPALSGACNHLRGLRGPGLLLWPIQPNTLTARSHWSHTQVSRFSTLTSYENIFASRFSNEPELTGFSDVPGVLLVSWAWVTSGPLLKRFQNCPIFCPCVWSSSSLELESNRPCLSSGKLRAFA